MDLDDRGWHEPLYQYSTTTIAAANVSSDGPSDVDDSVLLPKVFVFLIDGFLLLF